MRVPSIMCPITCKANIYHLLTESEVITGKSQTDALMYWPSDSCFYSQLKRAEKFHNARSLQENNAHSAANQSGRTIVAIICRNGPERLFEPADIEWFTPLQIW